MESALEVKPGRPFPKHISDVLESYYKRGMVGWSADKAAMFEEALGSLPLSDTQLKVG